MANKKNYYKNKNKNNKKSAQNVVDVSTLYSEQQLSTTIADLGISEATCQLLTKNRINLASDLVKRTEKDMYRVQGLNKKILFEVKDCLKAFDMQLRVEEPQNAHIKTDEQQDKASKQDKKKDKSKDNKTQLSQEDVEPSKSKFGLADKKATKSQDKPKSQEKQKPQDKEVAPQLAKGEWRKVMKGGKWGYSDGSKIVIPTMYDEIYSFKEDLASVEIDEKCGYIDRQNNVVIPLDYEDAMSFSEGLAMVVKGGKCGYINKNNEVIIPFQFDAATPFEDGEAKVKKDGKWGTLTIDNKVTWI